jgi:tetratricopeptide (TPR) repeat protein
MVITLLLSASLVAQAAAPQATAPPPTTEQLAQAYYLFLQGRSLEGNGDVAGAIATYKKVLELTPKAADVHAELAGLHARQGNARDSLASGAAALVIDPANREAHRILGFVQSALAERTQNTTERASLKTQAIAHFEQSLATGVRDPSAELSLGRLYVETAQYAKAIPRLQKFLLDQPGYPEALLLLAQALERVGKHQEAVPVLEELVSIQPAQLPARGLLASLYERAGRWRDAATTWGDLARLNPRNTTYRTRQAMAQVNGGDVAGGRQQLVDLTTQSPRDISAWYLLAQVEQRNGNPAGAETAAQRIAEIDPGDARGTIALAASRSARADYKGAVDVLDARVKAATDRDVSAGLYARLVSDLATALQNMGDKARAVAVLEAARQRVPDDEDTVFALAAAYERDQRFDQAEKMFRDMVARDPHNAPALNYLGYMLADRGQKLPEALDLIKRALAVDADNPSYLDSLGWAYVKSSQLEPARDPLERAAAALPRVSVIQDHLAQLYFQLKRYRDAATAWDKALGGDREGIDVADITKKRDRARDLAGR